MNRFSYLVSFCAWIDTFKSSFLAAKPFVNNSSFSIAHCNVACQPLRDVGLGDCLMSCFWDCCLRNMMTLSEKSNFLFHLNWWIKPWFPVYIWYCTWKLPHADCDARSVRQPDWYARFHQRDRPALPVEMSAGLKHFLKILMARILMTYGPYDMVL